MREYRLFLRRLVRERQGFPRQPVEDALRVHLRFQGAAPSAFVVAGLQTGAFSYGASCVFLSVSGQRTVLHRSIAPRPA